MSRLPKYDKPVSEPEVPEIETAVEQPIEEVAEPTEPEEDMEPSEGEHNE